MADPKRYKDFRKRMEQIQKSVSFSAYKETVISKILEYVSLHPDADPRELRKEITAIFGESWESFADDLFRRYDDIIEITNKTYYDLGGEITRDNKKIIAIEKVNETRLGQYEERFAKRLIKVTRQALSENVDFKELRYRISKIGGRVSGYADVLAATQMMGYGREIKYQKANIGEVYWYEYVGNIRKTTRPFCLQHKGNNSPRGDNHYHIDEINEMDNGPKQLKPVITYAGGWNCRHDWEPDPFYKGKL